MTGGLTATVTAQTETGGTPADFTAGNFTLTGSKGTADGTSSLAACS